MSDTIAHRPAPAVPAAQQPRRKGRRPMLGMGRTIVALMLREIASTYGRSAGGYLWVFLDPIMGIALLTIVFQVAMGAHKPAIGHNFPLFYATGYLPFAMFNDVSSKMAGSLQFSRPLLAYPAVTFVDALLARLVLNALTHFVVFAVVILAIAWIYGLSLVTDVPTVVTALSLITLFSAGVGTMNCFLRIRLPVWERVWSIAMRPLMLVSGVFYTYDMMPITVREVIWFNPVLQLVGLVRKGVYVTYNADYVSVAYIVSLSLFLMLMGLVLLWRRYRDLLELA